VETQILLVMGVSGSGKTTVGKALAEALGWEFADADDYHPESNLEKMRQGQPLTDADREPWLRRLHELLEDHLRQHKPVVLACSALKARYREILVGDLPGTRVVFLSGSRELIEGRMQRRIHFMPASLLGSQLSTLEPPSDAIVADIRKPVDAIVEAVLSELSLQGTNLGEKNGE